MEVCRNVYIEENINKNSISKSIKKIKSNKADVNLYLICVMRDSHCIMEIFHYSENHKPNNKNKKYMVIGIANDKSAAVNLAAKILQDYILQKNTLTSSEIFNFFSDVK